MLECPDCSGTVSCTAAACPHCGHRVVKPTRKMPLPLPAAIAVVVLYLAVGFGAAYAFPSYAIIVLAAALVAGIVEARRGIFRRG